MRAVKLGAAAVLLSLGIGAAAASEPAIPPFDEGHLDPEFAAFRIKLLKAIDARDVDFLRRHLHPKINLELGIQNRHPRTLSARDLSPTFWQDLRKIVALGGRFTQAGDFVAPYTFAAFLGDRDFYRTGFITAQNVNARAAPDENAPVVRQLTYALVDVTDWHPDVDWRDQKASPRAAEWVEINLNGSGTAYVAKEFIENKIDKRAIFVEENGVWMLRTFVSGG